MPVNSPCYTSQKYDFGPVSYRDVREKGHSNSLGKQQLELRLARDQLECRRQANDFFAFFFWGGGGVGGDNKTLNDWPREKQSVLFPFDLNVPPGFVSETIEGLRETKLIFPQLGASR